MNDDKLGELTLKLKKFANDRDWNQFHSPKNLAMALTVEAAELMEHFQWLTEEESLALSDEKREPVALEMADVFLYLLRMADMLNIDLLHAAEKKFAINEQRYPAARVKGRSDKYTEYE